MRIESYQYSGGKCQKEPSELETREPVAQQRPDDGGYSKRSEAEDFTSLITVRLKTTEHENMCSGTTFGKQDPRLVRINDFRLEAPLRAISC